MTRFPCDDDPDDLRQAVLATVREARDVAARPGTPKSVRQALVKALEKGARENPAIESTLRRAAREIKGRRR
jgi:hypothetical protein